MKKLFLGFLMLPSLGFASPFLICDPYPTTVTQPSEFVVTISGMSIITSPAVNSPEGKFLKLDLGPLNLTGTKTVTARAKNQWGESADSLPLTFTVGVPTKPTGITLSVN